MTGLALNKAVSQDEDRHPVQSSNGLYQVHQVMKRLNSRHVNRHAVL